MFVWILKRAKREATLLDPISRCMLAINSAERRLDMGSYFHSWLEHLPRHFSLLIVLGWIFNKPFAVESEANAELFINSASLLCLAFHFVCCFVELGVAAHNFRRLRSTTSPGNSTSSPWKFIFLFRRMFTAPFPFARSLCWFNISASFCCFVARALLAYPKMKEKTISKHSKYC